MIPIVSIKQEQGWWLKHGNHKKTFGLNFPYYIAKRYLVSKKSHNIINIISVVSVVGITVGTMALIIVLSVFNGFESLVISLFNTFNPDLEITIEKGKTFQINDIPEDSIREIPGVLSFVEVVEENALIKSEEKQHIVTLKGVSSEYEKANRLDSMIIDGEFLLKKGKHDFAVLGAGVAYYLDVHIHDYMDPLVIYVPDRFTTPTGMNFESAFNRKMIFPSGVFSVQQDFDTKYVLVPLDFARGLLDYESEVTSVEIGLTENADLKQVQATLENMLGPDYKIKNRFQQQELLYKIMKSEKWVTFSILAFILLIATFNVVGSLSMLILDKKKDIAVLYSMGANNKQVRQIFLFEGLLIVLLGGFAGLILGALVSYLQQTFGIIRLGAAAGSFVVEYYPVEMQITDFISVFVTVLLIGFLAAWYPVKQITRKYLHRKLA